MRLLVVDPRLLVEAVVASDAARRLLVLLDYGRVANLARLYASAERRVRAQGDVEAGGPSYEDLLAAGEDRLAELAHRLGPDAPDDLALVLSSDLLDELDDALDKLHERKLATGLDRATLRATVLAHTSVLLLGSDPTPKRDWYLAAGKRLIVAKRTRVLDAAAQIRAYAVVSVDESLVMNRDDRLYVDTSTGQEVRVLKLEVFAARHLRGFELDSVPLSLSSVPLLAP